jgi:hypothetical protein
MDHQTLIERRNEGEPWSSEDVKEITNITLVGDRPWTPREGRWYGKWKYGSQCYVVLDSEGLVWGHDMSGGEDSRVYTVLPNDQMPELYEAIIAQQIS